MPNTPIIQEDQLKPWQHKLREIDKDAVFYENGEFRTNAHFDVVNDIVNHYGEELTGGKT